MRQRGPQGLGHAGHGRSGAHGVAGACRTRHASFGRKELVEVDLPGIRVNAAIGGSTNAVIHLKAIAGRIGVDLQLEDWPRVGRGTPTLVDLQG